jgi:hypothetical protein
MKQYSNPGRKPMMYGGSASMPMKRMSGTPEKQQGERRNPAGPSTIGSTQGATKAQEQMQRRETLTREIKAAKKEKDTALIERFIKASNSQKGDGPIIKGILQREGLIDMPSGDKEPAGKMYGGKARKK